MREKWSCVGVSNAIRMDMLRRQLEAQKRLVGET